MGGREGWVLDKNRKIKKQYYCAKDDSPSLPFLWKWRNAPLLLNVPRCSSADGGVQVH